MAQQNLNVGTVANDGTGDALRDAMVKTQANFTELYELANLAYGGCGMDGNATATTIAVAGTYYKVLGTTTANTLTQFTHTNNRLTYTGTDPKFFRLIASPISMITAASNVIVAFKFALNGTVIGYPVTRKIGTGSDIGACSLTFGIELTTNDYIELFVTNETSATTVTVEDLFLSLIQIS